MDTNYLDWYDLFVNEVVGSPTLFIVLAMAVIAFIGARSRFPNPVIIMILSLFILMMSPFFSTGLVGFVILLVTGFVGWQMSRFISRG